MFLTLSPAALSAPEQTPDYHKALKEIQDFADDLCVNVSQKGESHSIQANGEITAKLEGLVRRLADAGFGGKASIDVKEYEGVVQDQLADTLKNIRQCKEHIFETLQREDDT